MNSLYRSTYHTYYVSIQYIYEIISIPSCLHRLISIHFTFIYKKPWYISFTLLYNSRNMQYKYHNFHPDRLTSLLQLPPTFYKTSHNPTYKYSIHNKKLEPTNPNQRKKLIGFESQNSWPFSMHSFYLINQN